jgi:hypothetical protein
MGWAQPGLNNVPPEHVFLGAFLFWPIPGGPMFIEKRHDTEFSPEVLLTLRRKEILERANCVNAVPLDYAISTCLSEMERLFQKERRADPLLEQTPPEAWIAAVLLDQIREIRSNVQIGDRVLCDAVQKYLRHHCPQIEAQFDQREQKLVTTIEPFLPAVRSLFDQLFDRRRSVFSILGLRTSSGSIRRIARATPSSDREKIIVLSKREAWSNRRLAEALDTAETKPRDKRWKSYMEMYHQNPAMFRVLKSQVVTKYFLKAEQSEG